MNRRIADMYLTLVENGKAPSLIEMASSCGVSLRTLQNDFHRLNAYLLKIGNRQAWVGVDGSLCLDRVEKDYDRFIDSMSFYSYALDTQERLLVLKLILFLNKEYITINSIAEKLSYSRSTLANDIAKVKEEFLNEGIHLHAVRSKGILMANHHEKAVRFMIEEIVKHSSFLSLITLRELKKTNLVSVDLFNIERDKIEKIVRTAESTSGYYLTAASKSALILYLFIVLSRNRLGYSLCEQPGQTKEQNSFIKRLAEGVYQYLSLSLSSGELETLSDFMKGLRYIRMGEMPVSWHAAELQLTARIFLSRLSRDIHYDLNTDYKLYRGIATYVKQASARKDGNMARSGSQSRQDVIFAPFQGLDAIIDKNFDVFEQRCRYKFDEQDKLEVKKMIFAAILRIDNSLSKLEFLVVCDKGEGEAAYLLEQLRYKLNMGDMRMTISPLLSEMIEEKMPDLIITTEALPLVDVPAISISVALSESDIDAILNESRRIKDKRYFDRIEMAKSDAFALAKSILLSQQPYGGRSIDSQVDLFRSHMEAFYSISSIFKKNRLMLGVNAATWQDAVREAATPMIAQGEILEEELAEAFLHVEPQPHFMLVEENLAIFPILRQSPKQSKEAGMSFIQLASPVPIAQNGSERMISNIGLISIGTDNQHIKAIHFLANRLREWAVSNQG